MTSSSRENVLISNGMLPEDIRSGVDVDDGGGNPELDVNVIEFRTVCAGATGEGSDGATSMID